MSSMLVSSESFTQGHVIASRAAVLLDYRFLDHEILDEAGQRANTPPVKIGEAIALPPSFFGMAEPVRKRLAAFLRSTVADELTKDRVVIHAPLAHTFVHGVAHVLRVRIVAPVEYRMENAQRELSLTERKARRRVRADDDAEKQIHAILDPRGHGEDSVDLTLNAADHDLESAALAMAEAAQADRYTATTYSRKLIREVALSHRLQCMLVDLDADTSVDVFGGNVSVRAHAPSRKTARTASLIEQRLQGIEGVEAVDVRVFDDDFMAASRR